MIDLHFHCLPGIDDGPSTFDGAAELCRAAGSAGTTVITATPHVLREQWLNEDPATRDELLVRLNSLVGGTPQILPGCEYFFSSDAVELWEMGAEGPLVGLNRGSFLLVEFPANQVPLTAERAFHEFAILGVTPLIAHPERNVVFSSDPGRLSKLVDLGAAVQITAASLLGEFGRPALAASIDFFRKGLVHVVASDAHSLLRRPSRLAEARSWVSARWGAEAESRLFERNPRAILDSGEVE